MDGFGSPPGSYHHAAPPGTPPASSAVDDARGVHFAPGVGFRHNAKVALAVVPSALTLAGGCGGIFLATSLVGAMIAYVLDALELAEASLVSAWIALLAAYVAVCAGGELFHPGRPPLVSLLLLLLVGVFLLLVGLWTSLQFLWVRRSFPGVTLAAERLLFAALPHVAGGILAWALVDAFGAAAAPFYLLPLHLWLRDAFGNPVPSSFRTVAVSAPGRQEPSSSVRSREFGSSGRRDFRALAVGRAEAATHALASLAIPPGAYLAAHLRSIRSDGPLALLEHLSSVAILASAPVIAICLRHRAGSLWFLEGGKGGGGKEGWGEEDSGRSLRAARLVALAAASATFAAGAEARVLFGGFGEYVRLPAPYGWLAVTFATYGVALVGAVAFAGAARFGVPSAALNSALAACGLAFAAALGAPVWVCATAAATAWALAEAALPALAPEGFSGDPTFGGGGGGGGKGGGFDATSEEKRGGKKGFSARAYAAFAAGATTCSGWFLAHHFGHLDVDVDGLPVSELCRELLLALAASLVLAGAAAATFSRARSGLPGGSSGRASGPSGLLALAPETFGTLVCALALLVARCEDAMHAEAHEDGEPMYPAYLAAWTSALGFAVADALGRSGRTTAAASWFARCVFAGKLALVALPGDRAVVPATLVAMAATSHRAFPAARAKGTLSAASAAVLRVAFLVFALMRARFCLFDLAFALTGHRPTDASVFGFLLASVGAGAARAFAEAELPGIARRVAALAVAAGAALVALQPPMPWRGEADGVWYDAEHVPDVAPDDEDAYGAFGGDVRGRARAGWPAWALVSALVLALFVATAPRGERVGEALKIPAATFAGGCFGAYLSAEHVFPRSVLEVLEEERGADATPGFVFVGSLDPTLRAALPLVAACAFAGAFLAGAASPSAAAPRSNDAFLGGAFDHPKALRAAFCAAMACVLAAYAEAAAMAAELGGGGSAGRGARGRVGGVFAFFARHFSFARAGPLEDPEDPRAARGFLTPDAEERLAWAREAEAGVTATCAAICFAVALALKVNEARGGPAGGARAAGGTTRRRSFVRLFDPDPDPDRLRLRALPGLGNVAVAVSFVAFASLASASLAPGSDWAWFPLASTALLAQEDGVAIPRGALTSAAAARGARRFARYAPPLAVASLGLACTALADALGGGPAAISEALANDAGGRFWGGRRWYAGKHVAATMAAAPCAFFFILYLWRGTRRETATLALFAPVNLLVLVAADASAVRTLAGVALASAAAQAAAQRRAKRAGMKAL